MATKGIKRLIILDDLLIKLIEMKIRGVYIVPTEVISPLLEMYSLTYLVSIIAKYTRNAFAGGICWMELCYSI